MVNKITPSQESINFIAKKTQKRSQWQWADSEWCGTVSAMVVKNVKDVNVLLELLPMCREYQCQAEDIYTTTNVNVVSKFGCKIGRAHV